MLSKPIAWLALSAAAAVVAIGLGAWMLLSPKASAPATGAMPSGLAADIVIPANSQAAPDFSLKDQSGQMVTVSGLKGKVVAITFLDSHCKQLCPIEADQLSQTQQELGSKSPMTLLVVSVAPATDTPDSERAFAATHHWTGDWHWVSGTPDQLAAVWKAYSIAVQNSPDDILHTSVVYLIDRNGYERAGWAAGLQPQLLTHDVQLLNTQA
jgi:cytochrome oxidase Cu insertion factor (SCO1/SenC/PrrC family)